MPAPGQDKRSLFPAAIRGSDKLHPALKCRMHPDAAAGSSSPDKTPSAVPAGISAILQSFHPVMPVIKSIRFPVLQWLLHRATARCCSDSRQMHRTAPAWQGQAVVSPEPYVLCGACGNAGGVVLFLSVVQAYTIPFRISALFSAPQRAATNAKPKSMATPAPLAVMIFPSCTTPSVPTSAPVKADSKPG